MPRKLRHKPKTHLPLPPIPTLHMAATKLIVNGTMRNTVTILQLSRVKVRRLHKQIHRLLLHHLPTMLVTVATIQIRTMAITLSHLRQGCS